MSTESLATKSESDVARELPQVRYSSHPVGAATLSLTGQWTTVELAQHWKNLEQELTRHVADSSLTWDLSALERLDHTGALFLWRMWGRSFPQTLILSATLRDYFSRLPGVSVDLANTRLPRRAIRIGVESIGQGVEELVRHLRAAIWLIGRLLLDLVDLARHPARWPVREISAGVFHSGAQALGILALVGFLIGVVLSYLSGDQLRKLGAEQYVVDLLGIACVRELGPLLAAILVAGRSGSAITAQLGVMRLNEELDALTTIGIPYTQRLILPKVLALALSQPLVGLWTSAMALAGGMVAAHLSLNVGYAYFLDTIPSVVPVANYWIGLGKGVVFGGIIALVACHYGLQVKPNTESLGLGTTSSVVVAISCVLVADAIFAVVFSDVGI